MKLEDCKTALEVVEWCLNDNGTFVPCKAIEHAIELGRRSVSLPVVDMDAIKSECYSDQKWRPAEVMPGYLINKDGQVRKERRAVARGAADAVLNGAELREVD